MKNLFYSIIALSALFLSSCGDDPTDLTMNFKLEYGGEPLVMFDEYSYPDGKTMNFTRFSFYISELAIIKDGNSTEIKDVDYIDLTMYNIDNEASETGYDYIIRDLEDVDFDAISFNIGLTPEMNSTVPADYNSSNPLSLSGEYWLNWESYIFAKIEGNIDLDGDGSLETGVALHLGSDPILRNIRFDNLDGDNEVDIVIDLKDVFDDGSVYDIASTPRIHSLSQIEQATELIDNLVQSFRLN
ncbi:MAG: hypothetical protein KJO50_06040 [Bacteroidia bacterium]|nr:hypothetical protein [Bacteroidia bacterium]